MNFRSWTTLIFKTISSVLIFGRAAFQASITLLPFRSGQRDCKSYSPVASSLVNAILSRRWIAAQI